jgi:hypothetical protein
MDAVFFDENGEFIIEPPEDYSDPWMADCTIKWYFCTKCFRYFHSPEDLKLHSASCAPKFENIIYREGNCCIAHVNSESSVEEKTICEWLMTVQADEIDAKYDSLAPQKWNTHKYQVFLLLEKSDGFSSSNPEIENPRRKWPTRRLRSCVRNFYAVLTTSKRPHGEVAIGSSESIRGKLRHSGLSEAILREWRSLPHPNRQEARIEIDQDILPSVYRQNNAVPYPLTFFGEHECALSPAQTANRTTCLRLVFAH